MFRYGHLTLKLALIILKVLLQIKGLIMEEKDVYLKVKRLELQDGQMVHDINIFPQDGMYIVYDGIADMIVSVFNNCPTTIPITGDCEVKDYEEVSHSTIEDMRQDIADNALELWAPNVTDWLENIDKSITALNKKVGSIEISVPQKQNTGVDSDILLKAIALSQNPELIKDIK